MRLFHAVQAAGLLSGALPPLALPPGPMRRKWSRVIWCPFERGSPGRAGWASRYGLRWMTCQHKGDGSGPHSSEHGMKKQIIGANEQNNTGPRC
jgi:hypothetical protein